MSWFLIGWLKLNLRKVSIAWFMLSKELALSHLGLKITVPWRNYVSSFPWHFQCPLKKTNCFSSCSLILSAQIMHINESEDNLSFLAPKAKFYLPFPPFPSPQFNYFTLLQSFFYFRHHPISIVFPPPPPHFHSLTCITTLQLSHLCRRQVGQHQSPNEYFS